MKYATYIVIAVCAALAIVAPVQPAQAGHDFVFVASTTGTWDDPNDWRDERNEQGTPGAADTATIPNGKTCRVTAGNAEAALSIDVDSGATLRIEDSGTLELNDDSSLDGDMLFYRTTGNCTTAEEAGFPQLRVTTDLTISGSGTIQAGCTGNLLPGRIISTGGTHTLTIGGSVEISNIMEFTTAVNNGGTISQNLDGQTMTFYQHMFGNGTYTVSAGTMRMVEDDDKVAYGSGQLHVTGSGTFDIPSGAFWEWSGQVLMDSPDATIDFDGGAICFSAALNLTSGTLHLRRSLDHYYGDFIFGGDDTDDLVIQVERRNGFAQTAHFGLTEDCGT